VTDPHEHLRQRLLARLQRRYDIVERVYTIGPLTVPFAQVRDPNKVLDDVAAEDDRREKLSGKRLEDDQLHLPYWAELWDSAFGVASFMVRDHGDQRRDFGTTDTLDLGCGMGLSGTVAAMLGHRVVLADLEADALLFARLNTARFHDRVRTRQLNWKSDRLEDRFDLILGADVLYERAQWGFLEPFWRYHLKPGGRVLLGEPGRQTGDLFLEWIAAKGWSMQRHAENIPTREKPIRILALSPLPEG
jgi:predicted nicotinamide N-methyase